MPIPRKSSKVLEYNDKLYFSLKFKLLFIHYEGPTDKRRLGMGEKQI